MARPDAARRAGFAPILAHFLASPLIAAGLLAASPVAAQEADPFRVAQDLYVLLPGGRGVGTERTVVPRDELLRTDIGYSAAARLAAPISLMAAGVPIDVPATLPLPEVRAQGDTKDRVGRGARIFCGAQRRVDHLAPAPSGPNPGGKRFEKHVMPCFVDADGDRRLESAFLVGTKWPQDRVVIPIDPVAYQEVNDIPIPGSWAWITFDKGALLQGPVLTLHVTMFGRPLPLAAVKLGKGDDRKRFAIQRSIKKEIYPDEIRFGAATISLLGYEPEGRKLRIRVERAFERADLDFEFINNTIYIYY